MAKLSANFWDLCAYVFAAPESIREVVTAKHAATRQEAGGVFHEEFTSDLELD